MLYIGDLIAHLYRDYGYWLYTGGIYHNILIYIGNREYNVL